MTAAEVTEVVSELLGAIPADVGAALAGVETRVVVTGAELASLGARADARGMFTGAQAVFGDGAEEADDPDAKRPTGYIFLVAANLRHPGDVRLTWLHEVGHALGMDEAEVAELGLTD
jgi:hypothetical protein